jgi:hypothetical protein
MKPIATTPVTAPRAPRQKLLRIVIWVCAGVAAEPAKAVGAGTAVGRIGSGGGGGYMEGLSSVSTTEVIAIRR